MKKIFIILNLLVVSVISFTQTAEINWNKNIDYAKKLSSEQNKPLVFFFSDNQSLSKLVLEKTFTNNVLVDKINTNFIPVLIQSDEVLAKEYDILKYPTLIVLGADNKPIDKIFGVLSTDEVFSTLENAERNYFNTKVAKKSNNDEAKGNVGYVYTYTEGIGSFVKINDKEWEHRTAFYTVKYIEGKNDTRHYYIDSEDKKTHIAIPKTGKHEIFIWKDKGWESTKTKISIIEKEVVSSSDTE